MGRGVAVMVLPFRSALLAVILHAACFALFIFWCPEPYMDEEFHVPQAQTYCRDEYQKWDPKITTLPGTYVVSRLVLVPHIFAWGPEACTPEALRCVNALFLGPVASLLLAAATREVHGAALTRTGLELRVLRLTLLPLHFFFCFLYYTDVASTSFVVAAFWLHCRKLRRWSALLGGAAVVMRQTNIVWVWALAVHHFTGPGLELPGCIRRLGGGLADGQLALHAIVGTVFVGFVVWNRGIVVGDRENHAVALHAAMLPYFAAFLLFFLGPAAWVELLQRLRRIRLRVAAEGVASALLFAAMTHFGSFAHPFLLADNRHITFYLWKDLLRRRLVREALLPAALGVVVAAMRSPGGRSLCVAPGRDIALWALCCALVLVPTPLLEFRYFVVPTLLALLYQPVGSTKEELAGVALSAFVNAATIALFLFRPFTSAAWGNTPQRFMW